MTSILLIEDQAIVRDAIRHFLFPQHNVVPIGRTPTPEELRDCNLVIIDTETLPTLNQSRDEIGAVLAEANVPAIWICPEGASLPESDARSIFTAKPLDAEVFRSAVEKLVATQPDAETMREPHADAEHIIELTEVIGEGSPDEETN
jgi:hypothetical protein